MRPRPPLPAGPYLVVGLARSGQAAALALRARGERVLGVDRGSPDVSRLVAAGVEVELDAHGVDQLAASRTLIKSPGVPAGAAAVAAARERGMPVLGELELGWRLLANEIVAVTGTNGKTTTTELLGAIHREAGLPVAVAGNVGTALCSLAGEISSEATIVCEASSFQLEDTLEFAPEGAVLLNITPDHLDRHGTFEAYERAKLQAFARQRRGDIAVLPHEFDAARAGGAARRVRFGAAPGAEMSDRDGILRWRGEDLIDAREIRLPGPHNRANAMAAAALALARGIDPQPVRAALRGFAGVAHRLELVRERGGVAYFNDSKATNVASTLVALRSFAGGVHLILGGVGKAQDFTPLRDPAAGACAAVYVIGADADRIAAAIAPGGAAVRRCGELDAALHAAARAARAGETVLLSPACASFDQFANFEARGESFRALVEAL